MASAFIHSEILNDLQRKSSVHSNRFDSGEVKPCLDTCQEKSVSRDEDWSLDGRDPGRSLSGDGRQRTGKNHKGAQQLASLYTRGEMSSLILFYSRVCLRNSGLIM